MGRGGAIHPLFAVLIVAVVAVFAVVLLLPNPEGPMNAAPEGKECLQWGVAKGSWSMDINPIVSQIGTGSLDRVEIIVTEDKPQSGLLPSLFLGIGEVDGEVWVSTSLAGPSGTVAANWESAHKRVHWDIVAVTISEDFVSGSGCMWESGQWMWAMELKFDGTGGARTFDREVRMVSV